MLYDLLEKAGYEVHETCRRCGALLESPHTLIMGVCTNCVKSSNKGKARIPTPKYRIGKGPHGHGR